MNTCVLPAMFRSLLSVFLFSLGLPLLWAQDPTLIDVSTLAQLNAVRYDLNGDGVVSFTTGTVSGSLTFADRAGVVAEMSDEGAYAEAFTGGNFYDAQDAATAITGTASVASNTMYYYKLSAGVSAYTGYELMNDLDFRLGATQAADYSVWAEGSAAAGAVAAGWEPIGDGPTPYTATFEGNEHTISNLFINRPSTSRVGLFGKADGATIRDLGLEGGRVTGNERVGALVGQVDNGARVSTCYAMVRVDGRGDEVGGLVGLVDRGGRLTGCYATGDVKGSAQLIGGLVGYMDRGSNLTSCYATGDVERTTASGTKRSVGGLVGGTQGIPNSTITSCYATGDVNGRDTDKVGGLVGWAVRTTITSCYATGDVAGDDEVGGLVGDAEQATGVTIASCYATGDVEGDTDVGGLVGYLGPYPPITASYYDSEQSSATKGIGNVGDNDPRQAAVSKTTSELQAPTDYSGIYADWDAGGTDHWDFLGANRYPKLKADLDGNAAATVAEFGAQLLVFVDADGAEIPRWPVFRIAEGTTPGTEVATLSALNAESDIVATVSLVGTSAEFEVGGSSLYVKAAVSFDHYAHSSYTLTLQFEEGGLTKRRSVVIEIGSPLDDDLDGLIGIATLAQLNAIRYDLNGDGMVDVASNASAYEAAFGLGSGESACASGCVGYELIKDLDFEDANADGTLGDLSIWAEGASGAGVAGAVAEGWVPIGTNSNQYTGAFEGNGYTIANIFINRPSDNYMGLFGRVNGGPIRNLGLKGEA